MPQRGLTLLELLITLSILSLMLSLGIPALTHQVEETRTHAFTNSLYEAIQATRTRAVSRNARVTLRAHGSWHQGWELFDDHNHNGVRDENEPLIKEYTGSRESGEVEANQFVSRYVSFIGTGESRQATGSPRGGLQMGTLTVCSHHEAVAYKLVLARMGRVRKQKIEWSENC